MSNLSSFAWLFVSTLAIMAYFLVMFQVVVDLFRDTKIGNAGKALWIVGLIFLPFITALAYILVHGKDMSTRQRAALEKSQTETENYLRGIAGTTPADQIAKAKSLLNAGDISEAEYTVLKEKALGRSEQIGPENPQRVA